MCNNHEPIPTEEDENHVTLTIDNIKQNLNIKIASGEES